MNTVRKCTGAVCYCEGIIAIVTVAFLLFHKIYAQDHWKANCKVFPTRLFTYFMGKYFSLKVAQNQRSYDHAYVIQAMACSILFQIICVCIYLE